MASDPRQQAHSLKQRLLDQGERFSFFQALRLLRLLAKHENLDAENFAQIRPRLGLGFPKTDLHKIEQYSSSEYRITANFLGLYGVDSPLPTFYTEDLLDEQADGHSVNREFLDIFARSIYPLFFQAWLKSKPALRILEFQDTRMLQILYSLVGVEIDDGQLDQPGVGSLLFCGSIYNQQTRTASGLTTIISACFPGAVVEVKELQAIWGDIPEHQRLVLGQSACSIGEDAHLGQSCRSLDGVTLCLSDLTSELFFALMPGGSEHARMCFLIDYYLIEPLPIRVELILRHGEVSPVELSATSWSRLGMDSWLLAQSSKDISSMSFKLPLRQPAQSYTPVSKSQTLSQ